MGRGGGVIISFLQLGPGARSKEKRTTQAEGTLPTSIKKKEKRWLKRAMRPLSTTKLKNRKGYWGARYYKKAPRSPLVLAISTFDEVDSQLFEPMCLFSLIDQDMGSPSTPAVVHVEEVVEGGGWSSSSRAIVLSVGSGREKVIPSRPSNLALCGSSNSKHEFLEGACQDEGRLNVEKDEFATEDSSGSRYCGLEVPGSRSADPRGVDDGSDSDDNASSSEDSEQSCYSTASNHGSAAEEAGQQDGDGKPTFAVVERQVAGKLDTSVPIQATQ
eukprot:1159995-Pelagomonas_calceolata.AAC.1